MADDPLTARALEKIAHHEAELVRLKIFVNEADKLNDLPPRFGDLDVAGASAVAPAAVRASTKRWQAGDFFNKPFSTAVRMIMVARSEAAGGNPAPGSVDEIHDALLQGSFGFETTGVDAQKNSIRISLGKNSAAFVRLPGSDLFGLSEWYGKRPAKARKTTAEAAAVTEADLPDEGDDQEASQ